ncbi:MAG: hypothetical protein EBR82_47410 [Caulobacteraceae bacterium]|nr:hypothetical protein [Caulobacteraceae bacterium]
MAYVSTIRALPWCQTTGTTAVPAIANTVAPSNFPSVVPYAQLFDWYWRVRRWRVSLNATYDLTNNVLELTQNGTVSGEGTLEFYPSYFNLPPPDERGLVCGNSTRATSTEIQGSGTITNYDDTTEDYFDSAIVTFELFRPAPATPYGISGTPRWLRIGAAWVPSLSLTVDSLGVNFSATTAAPFSGLTLVSTNPAVIDGVAVPLWTQWQTGGNTTGSVEVSVTLTPDLYWGYDPGDGDGPIWDTTTGARTARAVPK